MKIIAASLLLLWWAGSHAAPVETGVSLGFIPRTSAF